MPRIEGALDNNWTVKAEYLYVDYGRVSNNFAGVSSATTTTLSGSATTRLTDHVFRVGLNYRFAPQAVVARY